MLYNNFITVEEKEEQYFKLAVFLMAHGPEVLATSFY